MCINIQWLYVLYISMFSITCMCKDISYRYILYGYMCIYNMYLYTHTHGWVFITIMGIVIAVWIY